MGKIPFRYDGDKHALSYNYWALAAIILLTLLYPVWLPSFPQPRIVMGILFSLIVVLGCYFSTNNLKELRIGLTLGALVLMMEWISVFKDFNFARHSRMILFVVFFGFLFVQIFKQILFGKKVDSRMIAATIVNFLVLGFLGTTAVQYTCELNPNAFNGMGEVSLQNYSFFYYTFITLTSVGYGDITPETHVAQSISVVMSIFGQVYFAIVVALIVGKYIAYES